MKLPNPLTIKQCGFNHLLKLKRGIRKPKPEPICLALPDDVIVTILSKVDIVTLRRCTLALSLDAILPQIVSFSTPLEATLFIPDKSRCWYGRLINKVLSKSIPLLLNILERCKSRTVIALTLTLLVCVCWWVNTPKLNRQAVSFFKKLSGLKSLEVELPTMPCYDCQLQPHLWFRWDAKFGVSDTVADYVLYVFADKVNDSNSDVIRRKNQGLKALKTVVYHTIFHSSIIALGYQGDDWKTGMSFTTKDAERNGGMVIGPQSIRDNGRFRLKILHLPSTLKFNRYTNEQEDPLQAQDVLLLFLAHVDGCVDRDDNDVIMACLGDIDDEEGEADQKTELREIVAQILADENCMEY